MSKEGKYWLDRNKSENREKSSNNGYSQKSKHAEKYHTTKISKILIKLVQ